MIKISWQDVIELFSTEFSSVFYLNNKQKLYFSFGERVEGAKETWMLIAFADGLLQNLEPEITTGVSMKITQSTIYIYISKSNLYNDFHPCTVSCKRIFSQRRVITKYIEELAIRTLLEAKKQIPALKLSDCSFTVENTSKVNNDL
jgi:hypothetical protein